MLYIHGLDGMELGLDEMVIIGNRSSKGTFRANKGGSVCL